MIENNGRILAVVASNPKPKRELQYPGKWLLHTRAGTVSLGVYHDEKGKPCVTCSDAA